MAPAWCPRCSRQLTGGPAGWRCAVHGGVEPLGAAVPYGPAALAALLDAETGAPVPAWAPWPLPAGWAVTGLRWAGRPRARAVAVGATGPGLLGPADLVLVAEEPGVGLGAGYAGVADSDPGAELTAAPYDVKIHAAGHPTPLWSVATAAPDRAAYVGEAAGCWLWVTVWPETEWMVVHDDLRLLDLRAPDLAYEIPAAPPAGPLLG